MEYVINEILPFYSVEKDIIVSKNNFITVGYEIINKPNGYSSLDYFERIFNEYKDAIISLGENVYIHKQDIFYEDVNENNIKSNSKDNILVSSLKKDVYARKYLTSKSFIFISKQIDMNNINLISDFLENCNKFITSMPLNTFKRLNENDIKNYVLSLFSENFNFNFKKQKKILRDLNFKTNTFGDDKILGYSLNSINDDVEGYKEKNGRYYSYIKSLCYDLDCPHMVNNIIHIPAKQNIIKKLKNLNKLSQVFRIFNTSRDNYLEMIEEDEKSIPVYHHFNVVAFVKDENEKHKIKNKINEAFSVNNINQNFNYLTNDLSEVFLNSIGGGASQLPITQQQLSLLDLALVFNNYDGEMLSNRNGLIFHDLKNKPIVKDLYKKPFEDRVITNFNQITIGPSGTGKSFFTNYLVSQYLNDNHKVIILDIGQSYKKQAKILKGDYHELTSNSSFNLLKDGVEILKSIDLREDKEEGEKILKDFYEFLNNFILMIWKGDNNMPTEEEKSTMQKIIIDFYEKEQINDNICFNLFYDFIKENQKKYNNKYFDFESFFLVTEKYYKGGIYENLLNGNFIDLSNNFIVFEIDKIKDIPDLYRIVVPIIVNFCNKILLDEEIRKNVELIDIMFDECWMFLANPKLSFFLEYLYRTARKLGGSANIILQNLEPLMKSSVGEAIVSNASTFVSLSVESKEKEIRDNYQFIDLTEHQRDLLLSLKKVEYGVFIKQGEFEANIYKILPSKKMFYLFNTDGKGKVYREIVDALRLTNNEFNETTLKILEENNQLSLLKQNYEK